MNLYEIRLDDKIIYNTNLLDSFFLDCQCALFLVDMTNQKSFDKVKYLISLIKTDIYPYLSKIIVETKSDLANEITDEEYLIYKNENSNIPFIKISVKTGDNLDNLLSNIYDEINSNNSEKDSIPINKVSKCISKNFPVEACRRSFSLILLGNSGVGKTNFMTRYSRNLFQTIFVSTTGMEKEIKVLKVNKGDYYKLTLFDTAGQERYRSLPKKYYKNIDGVLLLFDINDKESFEDVNNWMKEINEFSGKSIAKEGEEKNENNIVIYLLGNKIDDINSEEKVTKEEIDKLANELGIKYYDISCKWNLNIDEVMARITLDCVKTNLKTANTFKITKVNATQRRGCC